MSKECKFLHSSQTPCQPSNLRDVTKMPRKNGPAPDYEQCLNLEKFGKALALLGSEGAFIVRYRLSAILLFVVLTANSFAQPAKIAKASAVPEPSVLVALGSGLVGIAALVRRRLSH
jgi:PEP-CTERM motif